jgi:hypothetical protein
VTHAVEPQQAKARFERRPAQRVRTAAVEAWPYRRVPRSRTTTDQRDARAEPPARQSLRLAALVFVQYGLLASDIRFVANANYLGVALANICIAINTWYLTRGIIEARSAIERLCSWPAARWARWWLCC